SSNEDFAPRNAFEKSKRTFHKISLNFLLLPLALVLLWYYHWCVHCTNLRWHMADDLLPVLPGPLKGVSRRNFIKGVITSGIAVSSANYLFRASSVFADSPGVGERLITLNVNGQQRRVDVMKQETLAWTLRYKLGLTGTKLGCDRA